MFAEMAAAMQRIKCDFIGSATMSENLNIVSVPQGMMSLVSEAADPVLRETLKDFGLQTFRRDVYRRGVLPLTKLEHLRLVDAVALEWSGQEADDPISLRTPLDTMQGVPQVYQPLMTLLKAGSQTIGSIRSTPDLADRPVEDIVQAVSLAIASGYAYPALPEALRADAQASVDRLNAAFCACNADGEDIGFLAAAALGSAVSCGMLESLGAGVPGWAASVAGGPGRSGTGRPGAIGAAGRGTGFGSGAGTCGAAGNAGADTGKPAADIEAAWRDKL